MRIAYSVTTALLLTGSALALVTGKPVTAQTALSVSQSGLVPAGAPTSFADLAERLQPAVVNIATKQKVPVAFRTNPFTGERAPLEREQSSGGSGFLISADGYIVTNNHVIASGPQFAKEVDSVTVKLFNGKEYDAEIIGRDPSSDVALIKIKAAGLPFVSMGSSKESRVGDWVVAIGNPLGLGSTVTAGIVSALQRNIGVGGAYDRFIQTDTAINPGNSGGPLFNLKGEVIGINNRLIGPNGANIGVGFAIPAEEVKTIVDTLRSGSNVERGYLGISIRPVAETEADALGLGKDKGEVVISLVAGQAGDKAGLKEEDIVLKVNGQEVTPERTLSFIVANTKPGVKIPLEILREGQPRTVQAVVGKRPPENEIVQNQFNPDDEKDFEGDGDGDGGSNEAKILRDAVGFSVIPITPQIARILRVPAETKGVVIDIAGVGTAAAAGLRRGDIIVSANYKPVSSSGELVAALNEVKRLKRSAIFLGIMRGNTPARNISIPIND